VRLLGAVAALEAATRVAGNALALVEDLHRGRGETHSDLGAGVAVGHRVVVAIKLEVVVDAHPGELPLGQLIARQRQGLERGAIKLLEDAATRPGELLEGAGVERFRERADGGVDRRQAEEALVAQARQYPALGQQDPRLNLGLIPGLAHPRRQHRHAVVAGQLLVAGIAIGLVAAGVADAALEVVGDQQLGDPAEELEAAHMGADPVPQALAPGRLDVGVTGRPEHGDEDLGLALLPCGHVDDGHRLAAVIDDQPLPWRMALAQGDRQGPREGPVVLAKGAVLIALGIGLPILLPEQVQGDPRAPQLAMHRGPVRLRALDPGTRARRKQRRLQGRLRQRLVQGPGQPGQTGPPHIVGDRGGRSPHRTGNVSVGAPALAVQAQHFVDLAHG
jgi:hypothetical protein